MDIQSFLHYFPYNLIAALIVGAILAWLFCARAAGKSLKLRLEEQATRLSHARREIQGELDSKNEGLLGLQSRLADADTLTQGLSQKAQLLGQEQQRYADLKDRYLNDVGRARDLLKIRADASAELERRFSDSDTRYEKLHSRWDSERKRYAKLVTEKNQQIADAESKLEGLDPTEHQDDDPSLQTYSHGQLESMLVDLRQQVSDKDTQLQDLELKDRQNFASIAAASTDEPAQERRHGNLAKLAERDREISRLRGQLLKQSVQTPAPLTGSNDENSQAAQASLDAKEEQLAQLQLELATLRPAATRLRRLETHIQQLAKGSLVATDDAMVSAMELELQQVQSQFLQHKASAEFALDKQSRNFLRQLNAKTDAVSRLKRQLRALTKSDAE